MYSSANQICLAPYSIARYYRIIKLILTKYNFHVLSRVALPLLNFLHLQKLTAGQSIIWSTSFLEDE